MATIGRHGYNKDYSEMTPTQKKNKRVDELKNKWAALNCIQLIRIWEHDINNNPSKVMEMLKKEISIQNKKILIKENKKKRH